MTETIKPNARAITIAANMVRLLLHAGIYPSVMLHVDGGYAITARRGFKELSIECLNDDCAVMCLADRGQGDAQPQISDWRPRFRGHGSDVTLERIAKAREFLQ